MIRTVTKPLSSVVFSLLVACGAAHGQVNRPHSENKRRATSAPLVFLDSTRERDGLKGPVRRVETEVVRVRVTEGKSVEESRLLLERTLYDERGRRVENETYPVVGTPTGQEVHRYDARGNLAETIVRDPRGATLSRTVYEYEFDAYGNWVKMTASVAVVNAGKTGFEPCEITNRKIIYYQTAESGGAKTPDGAGVAAADVPTTNEEQRGVHAEGESPRAPARAGGESLRKISRAEGESSHATSHAAVAKVPEVYVGTLNDRATSLPRPTFTVALKRLETPVTVSVEVVVDPTGRVVEAKAQNGSPALREAAESAARRATFLPFYVEGRPVRAKGWLNYGFLFSP
ncbi:MAG: hypothetical protein QOF61_1043 [Acidobacteriota bacterium]|nr:hypothetical protein [Acidobacteriota bacterium]